MAKNRDVRIMQETHTHAALWWVASDGTVTSEKNGLALSLGKEGSTPTLVNRTDQSVTKFQVKRLLGLSGQLINDAGNLTIQPKASLNDMGPTGISLKTVKYVQSDYLP